VILAAITIGIFYFAVKKNIRFGIFRKKEYVIYETPKQMDLQEFRDSGVLQEANRRFFHPLGLALAILQKEETKEFIDVHIIPPLILVDKRDTDRVFYQEEHMTKEKADNVKEMIKRRAPKRVELLGEIVQHSEWDEEQI
jgi:hypothetical protein